MKSVKKLQKILYSTKILLKNKGKIRIFSEHTHKTKTKTRNGASPCCSHHAEQMDCHLMFSLDVNFNRLWTVLLLHNEAFWGEQSRPLNLVWKSLESKDRRLAWGLYGGFGGRTE